MELISRINWVDILVIILLLRISCVSFQHGLSYELFSLAGVLFTIVISLNFYTRLGQFFSETILGLPLALAQFLSFLIVAIIIAFLFRLARSIMDKLVKIQWHAFIDSVGGLIAGVSRACLTVSLVLMILVLLPLPYMQWSIRDRSLTGMFFLKVGTTVYAQVNRFIPGFKAKAEPLSAEEVMGGLTADKSLSIAKEKAETPQKE
jgi:uncharacterized membrane protein required for colicin V production